MSVPEQTRAEFVSRFRSSWKNGEHLDANTFLEEYPEVDDSSIVIDLAYEEYCMRVDAGETPDRSQFCDRFSTVRWSLHRLLQVHSYVSEVMGDSKQATMLLGDIDWPSEGDEVQGFKILRLLGRGGLARVYLARESDMGNRTVAVKFSRDGRYEAATMGKLTHENIVTAHYAKEADSLTAICMPYKGAATLANVLDMVLSNDRMPTQGVSIVQAVRDAEPAQGLHGDRIANEVYSSGTYVDAVAHIGVELCKGLVHAHDNGVIHGDLKPSNILVTPTGAPMLMDFNLSVDEDLEQGRIGGTLAYMAPEQIRTVFFAEKGKDSTVETPLGFDERADIFSLGAIMYQLLTGKLPFNDDFNVGLSNRKSINEALTARKYLRPIRQIRRHVNSDLAATIHKCLAHDPADRPSSAKELLAQLERQLKPKSRGAFSKKWGLLGIALLFAAFVPVLSDYSGTTANEKADVHSRAEPYQLLASDPLCERAIALTETGEYEEAIALLTPAIAELTTNDRLFARATAYRLSEQFKLADEDYVAMRVAGNAQSVVEACRGHAYCQVRQFGPATSVLQRCDLADYSSDVRANLIYAQIYGGSHHLAQRRLQSATDAGQRDIRLWRLRLLNANENDCYVNSTLQLAPNLELLCRQDDSAEAAWLAYDLARVCAKRESHHERSKRLLLMSVRLNLSPSYFDLPEFKVFEHEEWFDELVQLSPDGAGAASESLLGAPPTSPRLDDHIRFYHL